MSAVVSIPRYPGDVTPEWLSAALSERRGPVEVADLEVAAIGTGQTGATYRLRARYATDPGGLPDTFVIKLPAQDDIVRGRVVVGYRSECAFYTGVADRVRIPTPQSFYCEIIEDAWITRWCWPTRRPRCKAISSPAAASGRRGWP